MEGHEEDLQHVLGKGDFALEIWKKSLGRGWRFWHNNLGLIEFNCGSLELLDNLKLVF